ncbi:hypothetical protein HDU76_009885, partial [Blyttiomyces sp. JEL0837]
ILSCILTNDDQQTHVKKVLTALMDHLPDYLHPIPYYNTLSTCRELWAYSHYTSNTRRSIQSYALSLPITKRVTRMTRYLEYKQERMFEGMLSTITSNNASRDWPSSCVTWQCYSALKALVNTDVVPRMWFLPVVQQALEDGDVDTIAVLASNKQLLFIADNEVQSELEKAIEREHTSLVRFFLTQYPEVCNCSKLSQPLRLAIERFSWDFVMVLLEHVSDTERNMLVDAGLDITAEVGHIGIFKRLLSLRDEEISWERGQLLMVAAVDREHAARTLSGVEIVEYLISLGFDWRQATWQVNVDLWMINVTGDLKDKDITSLFGYALNSSQGSVALALLQAEADTIAMIEEAHFTLDSCFIKAAELGLTQVLEYLLTSKISPIDGSTICEAIGNTAPNGHWETVKALYIWLPEDVGSLPEDWWSVGLKEVVKHGDISCLNLHLAYNPNLGIDSALADEVFILASRRADSEILERLIGWGVDVHARSVFKNNINNHSLRPFEIAMKGSRDYSNAFRIFNATGYVILQQPTEGIKFALGQRHHQLTRIIIPGVPTSELIPFAAEIIKLLPPDIIDLYLSQFTDLKKAAELGLKYFSLAMKRPDKMEVLAVLTKFIVGQVSDIVNY